MNPMSHNLRVAVASCILGILLCGSSFSADDGQETVKAIQDEYIKYVEFARRFSIRTSEYRTLEGKNMAEISQEHVTDGRNGVRYYLRLYDNFSSGSGPPDLTSIAGLSRIRGKFRQSFGLRRSSPSSPWILTGDLCAPLTKENEKLAFDHSGAGRLLQLEAIRCAPGFLTMTIPELVVFPGFRINSLSEDRSGPERRVLIDFSLIPSLDSKAPKCPVRGGQMCLRPDAFWTLKSGVFQMEETTRSGKMSQCKVTNTFYDEGEKKSLPKEVRCVAILDTKQGKRVEETVRFTFEFSEVSQVPEERLSLTQFGMAEREPIDPAATPKPDEPGAAGPGGQTNFLVAQSIGVPPYVWVTGGGLLLLVIGISIGFWNSRRRQTSPPGTESTAGEEQAPAQA